MGTLGFLYFLLFVTTVTCCGISMQYGNITLDQNLEVNDTLIIQCSLFSNSIVYDDNVTYSVSSQDLQLKFGKDFLRNIDILDNHTIEYSVENAQEYDSGTYSCYVTIPKLNKNVLVCSTSMSVGYKPLPVQNFSCISLEYTNLTCSWVKPFNPVKTDYTLWDLAYEKWKRQCGKTINETSCQWTVDSRPPYRRQSAKLYFLLVGNNSLGEIKETFSVDNYKIVKPGIPRNISFMNVTETSLEIFWSPPKHMEYGVFSPGLDYSIQYQPISPYEGTIQEVTVHSLSGGSKVIEDLVPNTVYNFNVRCKSHVVDNDDFWSPSAVAVEKTKADVPYLAPEMSSSSFDVENILGNRTVTLYWKAVPSEFENGENFYYVIKYHIHHVPSRSVRDILSSRELKVGNKTLHTFPHLDLHSAYMFKIYAVNDMGPSENSSQIVIDKVDKLLDKPKEITVISYGQGQFNLSWKASNQRPYNFTLYWCKTVKPRPSKCEGPLEWLYTTKTKHVLQLPDKDTNYQFAVSANDDGQTSGLSWASCIVYHKGANYAAKSVELTPKNATSLKIHWSLECEAQKNVILEYSIEYCEYSGPCPASSLSPKGFCSDWKTVIVSDRLKEEFLLGNLKPYTSYLAYMRVHTESGWSGNSNLVCETTMPTAPSDPPGNVKVIDIDGKFISVSFDAPQIPNGVISRYIVYYNKSDGTSHHKEIRVPHKEAANKSGNFSIRLMDFMAYYTNYSIEISACVDQACSDKSEPVYAFTSISQPDIINSPRIEVVDKVVNISWDDPILSNGPLDYFQILMESRNYSVMQIFNVTGQNYLILNINCSETKEIVVYNFRVRAVNIKEGIHLHGHYSKPTKNELCVVAINVGLAIGIAVGATFGILALVLMLFLGVSWMKKQVDMISSLEIQLPKDLDSPLENPLSSYDKFKNGLQTNHDSGIACDTSYERLCEFASEKDLGRVIDENSQKLKRKSSGRNNSGESTASGKCHDSISSSNTTKTHLSIDSGAEVDSPPSPDGLFSDTSSSHTTPRSYKPDLTIVQECNGCTSKDSGLDRDGTCSFMNRNVDIPSKFAYFVKKKNFACSNINAPNGSNRMPSYSKFAVMGGTSAPPFIPYGEQSLGLLEQHSFSQSEPSVAEFDVGNGSEPLMPYSKFGLARSAGNGLNVANQPLVVNQKTGYSKFGTVYRALKRQDSRNIPTLNGGPHNTLPKFVPQNPQTITALNVTNHTQDKQLPVKDNDKAYSKFGVSSPKNAPVNGYVCFRDRLTYPTAESSVPNQAYSKLGMTANQKNPLPESDHTKENGVIINAAELQALPLSSQPSYVSFQNKKAPHPNAKDVKLNDSPSKDENDLTKPESEQSPIGNHKIQSNKDNVVAEEDIDCIIPDSSSSLLDEITSDLGSKLIPTNFSISANNDSKGFLLQEDDSVNPSNQLSNIMDCLFGVYDFHIPEVDVPVCIDMDDLKVTNPCTSNTKDSLSSSLNNHTVDSTDLCEHCESLGTDCTCSESKNSKQTDVICNGVSSPLSGITAEYVPLGSNSAC